MEHCEQIQCPVKCDKDVNLLNNKDIHRNRFDYTVDSAYLQVVFVRENIAMKWLARLPKSSIQTGSMTELQADDCFVPLTDVQHWDLNHLILFLCKTNHF